MGYKMILGLCALLMVLMMDQADSTCCHAKATCRGWFWGRRCTGRCPDGTPGTPYCGYGKCNLFGCNCNGGCRHAKRDMLEEARSLLELLRGGQEDTAPEESAMEGRGFGDTSPEEGFMAVRGFGDHDTDKDRKLSKQEALGMLEALAEVDVSKLPADWFESMDKNGNGYIDPEEYDEDLAKTLK
ncbi:uncharacterized protein LOC144880727 [Branchiostoma floridae x Branchiostoma japonicum]